MKEKKYVEFICKGFCKFYKEGKEELHCSGYELLKNNLTIKELTMLSDYMTKTPSAEFLDDILVEFICSKCEFQTDGCDFREGLESPPCGGYIIISRIHRQLYKQEF